MPRSRLIVLFGVPVLDPSRVLWKFVLAYGSSKRMSGLAFGTSDDLALRTASLSYSVLTTQGVSGS